MRAGGVFEIHTSKLISEWPGLYLPHGVREREGEWGDSAPAPRAFNAGINGLLRGALPQRERGAMLGPFLATAPRLQLVLPDAGAPSEQGLPAHRCPAWEHLLLRHTFCNPPPPASRPHTSCVPTC